MSAFLGNGQEPRVFWYQDFRNQTESRISVYMWTDGHMWEVKVHNFSWHLFELSLMI